MLLIYKRTIREKNEKNKKQQITQQVKKVTENIFLQLVSFTSLFDGLEPSRLMITIVTWPDNKVLKCI